MPAPLTPQQFVAKWRSVTLKERSAVQEHFLDLCQLLGHDTPATADRNSESFTFESGVHKVCGCLGIVDAFEKD